MMDHTNEIEAILKNKDKIPLKHLIKLWVFVFSSTKWISIIYLGLFLLLSLLRPIIAFIWEEYVAITQSINLWSLGKAILLLSSYWAVNFLSSLIDGCLSVYGDGDLEQLDAVQLNRQKEHMQTKLLKIVNSITYEYFESAIINDKINHMFEFVGNPATGVNREVMLKGYIILAKVISLLSITVSLYFFSPWLCVILLIVPLPVLWTTYIYERLQLKFKFNNIENRRKIEYYQELMLSASNKEMKVMGLHTFFFNKWKSAADEYTKQESTFIRKQTYLDMLNAFILCSSNICGFLFSLFLLTKGEISLSEVAAVFLLIEVLVTDAILFLKSLMAFLGKKHEAYEFDRIRNLPKENDEGGKFDYINNIVIKNVRYRYPFTEKYVLDGINLKIFKGEKIAFVGENGEGKSTCVKLIAGLLYPSSGKIIVNDEQQEEILSAKIYENQSNVSQEPVRYTSFTVKENVFIGDTLHPINEKKIDEALSFSGFIEVEKEKVLGKEMGGIDLSGGQWQKLAIARAVYRSKDFIILDEPTSNLDPIAENEIFNKYIKLSEDKTVIFVTHRISIAALADRIVVFKDNNIIEDGTHEELSRLKGEYYRLYLEQAKWYTGTYDIDNKCE